MATLKEIQTCQLGILKTVADICDRHDIPYYLACGTFLGAVRHKGFIPWDDDVDIYMEYEDLKRFKRVCKKELPSTLFYQDFETDPSASWIFTKIRANNTFMPEVESNRVFYHQGIWLDIFPLLKAARDEDLDDQIRAIKDYQDALLQYVDISKHKGLSFKHKLVKAWCNLKAKRVEKRSRRKFEKLASFESGRVITMSNAYWENDEEKMLSAAKKRIISTRLLEREKYPFEDTEFYGFKDYDAYLTQEYGPDYMTPKQWGHIDDYSKVKINTQGEENVEKI